MEANSPVAVLSEVIGLLEKLEVDDRRRILQTVDTYFDMAISSKKRSEDTLPPVDFSNLFANQPSVPFGQQSDLSPKDFLLQKRPATDVQKITCLAYFLATYRDTPHFTTRDLSRLNMEAAQIPFANIAYSASNAAKSGYLVPAGKERRQLSAHGEQFVIALPDQAAAKAVMAQRQKKPKLIRVVKAAGRKKVASR